MKKLFAVAFYLAALLPASAQTLAPVSSPCSIFGSTSGTCLQGAGPLGSPSSVGTLPAFTLGGTISGGGNQLNNIVIGASTPLAGTFSLLAGTTSITSPLHIGGSGTTQSATYKTTTGVGAAGADHVFQVGNNGATEAMRVYNSGAVSIGGSSDGGRVGTLSIVGSTSAATIQGTTNGTTNASSVTVINSTSQASPTILANEAGRTTVRWGLTIGNWAEIADFGTNGLILGEFSNAPVVFGTNNLERARISGAGGVSIGTTTDPGVGSLQVNTTVVAPNITSDAGLTDTTLCWKNSATTGTFLKGSGTLGICLGTSGAQFKTAFAPMIGGLEEVMELNLQNYRYRNGYGDDGERMQYGLTAQDVDRVMPDLVRRDASGEAINYDAGAFLFIGLRAIQELKADNDDLRACQATWKCRIFGMK